MIEHVIAESINHPCPDYRVIQSRVPHNLFRRKLRFMISRIAVWARAEEAHQHNLPDAGAPRGPDDISCPCDMNSLIRLVTKLAVDSRAMRNRVTPGEGLRQKFGIREVAWHRTQLRYRGVSFFARGSSRYHNLMSIRRQTLREVAPDESSAASNCNSHFNPPMAYVELGIVF